MQNWHGLESIRMWMIFWNWGSSRYLRSDIMNSTRPMSLKASIITIAINISSRLTKRIMRSKKCLWNPNLWPHGKLEKSIENKSRISLRITCRLRRLEPQKGNGLRVQEKSGRKESNQQRGREGNRQGKIENLKRGTEISLRTKVEIKEETIIND